MADYFSGNIQIPKKFINESEELRAMIAREVFNGDQYYESDGIVQYGAAKAYNGEFENLEAYLRENSIPFDRNSEGYCEIDPECAIFRPAVEGFDGIDTVIYNAGNGTPVIELTQIKNILDECKTDEEIAAKIRALYEEYSPISLEEYMEKYGDKIRPAV